MRRPAEIERAVVIPLLMKRVAKNPYVVDLDRDREVAMQDARCFLCCVSMTDLRKLAS